MRFLRIVLMSVRDFFKDNGVTHAAAMSYFFMMSVIPFCFFVIALMGHFLGESREFYDFFISKLVGFFPSITEEITDEIRRIVSFSGIGRLSIIVYGFLSYGFFLSVEAALNDVFEVKAKRNPAVTFIYSIVFVTVIIALLLMSFALTLFIPHLKIVKEFLPWLRMGIITAFVLKYIVPFFLALFSVVSAYKILPGRRVRLRHALYGGLFTTVMLEVAKHLFTWYIGSASVFGTIYGSLTTFVVFLLWVFYSSAIFLLGGEIVHNVER